MAMNAIEPLHDWALGPEEAAQAQIRLRERLILTWDERRVETVGGVDIALGQETARAALVVLRFPELEPIEAVTVEVPLVFPYIPGLLAFREGPALLAAWQKLDHKPDLLMFDGQGIAHPRGMGIAAHMGMWLDLPTIGVAKSRLYGKFEMPGPTPGDETLLIDPRNPERVIGVVLRTKKGANPLFISPGHRMDVQNAAAFVRRCLAGYRLPEPTRQAHNTAGAAKING